MTIEPEPSEAEREAIVSALAEREVAGLGEWAKAALIEGVEGDEPDP